MSENPSATLQSIPEVQAAIMAGESLFLAGSRETLSQLPRGSWVGGSICYFRADEGKSGPQSSVYATGIPEFALGTDVADYGIQDLAEIYGDAPPNGFTFLVLPAETELLRTFAKEAPAWTGFLIRPVVGWVSGVRVDRIGKDSPAVFNGRTGGVYEDRCAALHVWLPPNKVADPETVSLPDDAGATVIPFPTPSPNGIESPGGAYQRTGRICRAANPLSQVLPGVSYRFAGPVAKDFPILANSQKPLDRKLALASNCILNYLYGFLEGPTSDLACPVSSGITVPGRLNQTVVRLVVRDVGPADSNF
jgi:hypothetical protein